MQTPAVPDPDPILIAPETWLIPALHPAGPDALLPVNSMLIRGAEPMIVDTGAPIHRDHWSDKVFGLVDPTDVRWIFLSHDDGDHTGGLHDALALCPNARLVTNFFTTERLALERPLPLERSRWVEPGGIVDAGDRRLRLFLPPIFDGPTTRGLLDERTGVVWAVDSFAALSPVPGSKRADIPQEMYEATFALLNSMVSPWHSFLDPDRYGRHVESVSDLRPTVVASAHGPVLDRPEDIDDAFERVLRMAGEPRVMPPGQETLDELLAAALLPAPRADEEPVESTAQV